MMILFFYHCCPRVVTFLQKERGVFLEENGKFLPSFTIVSERNWAMTGREKIGKEEAVTLQRQQGQRAVTVSEDLKGTLQHKCMLVLNHVLAYTDH